MPPLDIYTPAHPYLSIEEERRLVLRVLAYWQDLRGGRNFPVPEDIDPAYMGDDWKYCALVQITPETRYRVIKAESASLLEGRLLPVDTEKLSPDSPLGVAASVFPKVVLKKVPISLGREFQIGGEARLGRALVAPLSSDDIHVDGFLVAVNWKADDGDGGSHG